MMGCSIQNDFIKKCRLNVLHYYLEKKKDSHFPQLKKKYNFEKGISLNNKIT